MAKTIVFDLRPLQIGHENRGIGMVAKSVLENIADDVNRYVFYAFDTSDPTKGLKMKIKNYTVVQTPALKTSIKSLGDVKDGLRLMFHRFAPLRPYKPDYFLQFDFSLGFPPFWRTKKLVIAYDLIPLILQNEYLPSTYYAFTHTNGKKARIKAVLRAGYYRFKAMRSYRIYRKAYRVIAISDTVRQSFITILKVKPGRIVTAPLAPVALDSGTDDSILTTLALQRPYVLYVGGTDSRKRIEEIVYAFNITRGRGSELDLVFAGNEFTTLKKLPSIAARNAITDSPYSNDIKFAGRVSDAQKNSLYAHAHAFIFCSIYEGFGLPVIEAQSNGCPVVSYDNSSLKEVGGGASLLIENGNYVKVAEAIGRLFDKDFRNSVIEKGRLNATLYSWADLTSAISSLLT